MTKEQFNWTYIDLLHKAEEEKPSYRDFAEELSKLIITYFREAVKCIE